MVTHLLASVAVEMLLNLAPGLSGSVNGGVDVIKCVEASVEGSEVRGGRQVTHQQNAVERVFDVLDGRARCAILNVRWFSRMHEV